MMNARLVSILVLCLGAAQANAADSVNPRCQEQKVELQRVQEDLMTAKTEASKQIRGAHIYGKALNKASEDAHRALVNRYRNQFKNITRAQGKLVTETQTFEIDGLKKHSVGVNQSVTFGSNGDGKSFMIIRTEGSVTQSIEIGANDYDGLPVAHATLVNIIDLSTQQSPKEGEKFVVLDSATARVKRKAGYNNRYVNSQPVGITYTKSADIRDLFDVKVAMMDVKSVLAELERNVETQKQIMLAACSSKPVEEQKTLVGPPAPDEEHIR